MRIGQDVSIQVCRDEGYAVMDYPVYKFKKDPRNTDCRITISYPDYIREEMGWCVGDNFFYVDMWLNWEDLMEMYLDNKEGIDSFVGGGRYDEIEVPEPYHVLMLASDLNAYCGLI